MKTKCFVVTGASGGIGRYFARWAAKRGHSLALVSRSKLELEKLADDIRKETDVDVSFHPTDLSNSDHADRCFKEILKAHPDGIRALLCFAGKWTKSPDLHQLKNKDFEKALNENLYPTVNTINSAIRSMDKVAGLKVVTIGGTSSVWMNHNAPLMSVTKAAISNYTRMLARAYLNKKMHVAHLLIDGPVDNERGRELNPEKKDNEFISMESISKEILHIIEQERDCWTYEWDIRPFTRETKLV